LAREVRGKLIFGAIGGLLLLMGAVAVGLTIYQHIREGRGAQPFQNVYGQFETWASYAGGIIGGSLMLLGGVLVSAWQRWNRSRLEGGRASNNRWRGP
jgi:hypothetical protein